ncbi:hypothetical protein [Thiomicrorhabdus chilensis]|uniref:hypothetical protein n=1 Tax=Thiomicrorhabdus chilensis TaxID=63656 RepID=UPI00048A8666|nr:hypothetical protein [Thiomicrorhabdus chilensis]
MDYLAEHKNILEQAVQNKLPKQIDSKSEVSVDIVRDLIEDGYLKAVDVSSFSGIGYLEPRITILGREYLNQLNERAFNSSTVGKLHKVSIRLLDWAGGILAGILIAIIVAKLI